MPQKAMIHVIDNEGKNSGKSISVMYNPTEYTLTDTSEVSKKGTGQLVFEKLNRSDFTVPLFFDTYEEKTDVRDKTKEITSLLIPDVGSEDKRPSVCVFTWGYDVYKGIITKINQKFTMFLDTGIPVRAELDVTFKAVESIKEQEKTTGISNSRKFRTVKSGDRLDIIAYKTLKDPNLWRLIANLNNIDNPLDFPTKEDIGRNIIIPDMHKM